MSALTETYGQGRLRTSPLTPILALFRQGLDPTQVFNTRKNSKLNFDGYELPKVNTEGESERSEHGLFANCKEPVTADSTEPTVRT